MENVTSEESGDTGIDMDAAVSTIGEGLGLGIEDDSSTDDDQSAAPPADKSATPPANPAAAADPNQPTAKPAPKSWAKETHALWEKLPPEAQAQIEHREKQILEGLEGYKGDATFGKSLREVFTPYKAVLQAQGVDEVKAVSYLMNAHYRLTQGTVEERTQAYRDLGKNLGLVAGEADPNAAAPDPHVKALTEKVSKLESSLTAREQASLNEARARVSKEVEAFASDPKNAYFNDVAEDVIVYLNAGHKLEDAYEKAVYANPVTRAKEIARLQTEHEAKVRENARLDALKGRKASAANVRSRDTGKAPTEPLGTMEETMKSTLADIRSRTH